MKKGKILLSILTVFSISTSTVFAVDVIEKDGNKNTQNEIDDSYKNEKGWDFYFDNRGDSNLSKKEKLNRMASKLQLKLLQKILRENQKQTKIQTKILALLQKSVDPKPKIITRNGKKCVANSSDECFDFASLLVAEAKKVPAMAEFFKDPQNISKAANYLKWQAKYFEHVGNIGNAIPLAYAQFGEKAYPIGPMTTSFMTTGGSYSGSILPKAQTKLIKSMKDKISFSFFIGKSPLMDIYSALSIVDIIKEYDGMDIELVFDSEKSKKFFTDAVSSVWKINNLKSWKHVKKTVNPKKFKIFKIVSTPSYVIKLNHNGKKEAVTFLRGKADLTSFRNKIISFLELKKLIDYKKFNEHNNWENGGKETIKVINKMYKDTHGVDVIATPKKDEK